jgi:hypothetical protein
MPISTEHLNIPMLYDDHYLQNIMHLDIFMAHSLSTQIFNLDYTDLHSLESLIF